MPNIVCQKFHLKTIEYFFSTDYCAKNQNFGTMLQTVTFIRLNEQNTEFAIEKYIAHDIKLKE